MKIYRIKEFLWGGGELDVIVSALSVEDAKKLVSSYDTLRWDLNYYTKDFDTLFDGTNVIELGTYNKDVSEIIAYNLYYSNSY